MKQYLKLPGLWLCMLAMVFSLCTFAQAGESYFGPVTNIGYVSHNVGTGTSSFNVAATGSYDAFTFGAGIDEFLGPLGVAGTQEISGTVAPIFGTVKLSNGAASAFNITNTAGIIVNTTAALTNGVTTAFNTNRANGLLAAIKFLGTAVYTPSLTPVAGAPDVTFTEGFVSKVNPDAFVFPVGNVTDLRPITVKGTGTFATSWNNANVASFRTGALPAGVSKINTNGFWEWAPSAVSTVTVSIPNEATFVSTASKLTIVGFDGSAWTKLGGAFTALTENSTNTLPVSVPANITAIAMGEAGVIVNAKVFLQGDMGTSILMRSDLQNYISSGSGLLPNISPFGGSQSTTYTNISNVLGTAGIVVDWIQVEVRLASNSYATAVETRSLLLKPDGSIVDSSGQAPTFNTAVGTARLVIRPRNHLAVMSNDITSFAGTVNYDFTTALAQANNDFADPAQMKLINGVWTLFSGDINRDNAIDALDGATFKTTFIANTFDSYIGSDLNMDGSVDGLDGPIFKNNFVGNFYSTMVNY